jgi:hypothetical protein
MRDTGRYPFRSGDGLDLRNFAGIASGYDPRGRCIDRYRHPIQNPPGSTSLCVVRVFLEPRAA